MWTAPLAYSVAVHMLGPRRQPGPHEIGLVEFGHHEADELHRRPGCGVGHGHLFTCQKRTLLAGQILEDFKLTLRFSATQDDQKHDLRESFEWKLTVILSPDGGLRARSVGCYELHTHEHRAKMRIGSVMSFIKCEDEFTDGSTANFACGVR